tara:strand:+ start:266 stop:1462 length:1197 start_codon:yes stop_codon:yes gene_type:complete
MKINCIGLGYVGLPTSLLLAQKNFDVVGVDIDEKKIKKINSHNLFFNETDLQDLFSKVVKKNNFKAKSLPEEGDVFFIVVPTPVNSDKSYDLSFLNSAVDSVIPFLKEGNILIIESTVPVKTTQLISEKIFKERKDLEGKIYVAYCPERVLPGNTLYELKNNDRVIGGINKISTQKVINFYREFVDGNLYEADSNTAELCKLAENSFRDNQIAFANELSIICDELNVNVNNLIKIANKHPRVNILKPGTGVGGHCIAVDPWFLISDFPNKTNLIKKSREVNESKTEWCIKKINSLINEYYEIHKKYPLVSCMGITYKQNSDDLRESPSLKIAKNLKNQTNFKTLICDPNLDSHSDFELSDFKKAYADSDIILWLVNHEEFGTIKKIEGKKELDFCGLN